MDYPSGHTYHHSHRRNDDDEFPSGGFPQRPPSPPFSSSPYPPPNQPSFDGAYPHAPSPYADAPYQHHPSQTYPPPAESYPPPPVSGIYHSSHSSHLESQGYYPPAPVAGVVSHSHHEEGGGGGGGHHFRPHMPGFIEDHFHGHRREDGESHHHVSEDESDTLLKYFKKKPTFRVFCKAGGDRYTLAVRDGNMVLAEHNPDDLTQHWYKDEKWSTKVKDQEGCPSFSLVNKATGQAVQHSVSGQPLKLIPYKPNEFDQSILWTESKALGQGFRTIRIVNNVKLSMDAFHGDEGHGGVHDGTPVALYDCWQGDNQQWKIVPYSY